MKKVKEWIADKDAQFEIKEMFDAGKIANVMRLKDGKWFGVQEITVKHVFSFNKNNYESKRREFQEAIERILKKTIKEFNKDLIHIIICEYEIVAVRELKDEFEIEYGVIESKIEINDF